MKNPIKKIKDNIIAEEERKAQEQQQRERRLHELEEKRSNKGLFGIGNPVKSVKTKREIKELKEEIGKYNAEKQSRRTWFFYVCIVVTIILFCGIMSFFESESGSKNPTTTSNPVEQILITENAVLITSSDNVSETAQDNLLITTASTEAANITESNAQALDTTSVHVHSYKDATCTTPKTCTSCGETSGSALGHNYSNGSCTRCGTNDPNYVAEDLVWISGNGSKYHSNPNCSGMKNPTQVSKSQAEANGRGPCSKCY